MDSLTLEKILREQAEEVHSYLAAWFSQLPEERGNAMGRLFESMSYSALGPGKRFRPVLAHLTGKSLGVSNLEIGPWAAAVEMVHTYSLIHDDLPCMDNDDERRGRPTNHKAYDEATALLAGDALLTEAFGLLGESYSGRGAAAGRLVALLAEAAGARGMIGGQCLDIEAEKSVDMTLSELRRIHELKTGRLIQVAVEGAAVLAGANTDVVKAFAQYGSSIGLAFQVADDLLDAEDEGQDGRSYVYHLGAVGAREELYRISEVARQALDGLPVAHPALGALIDWNQSRTQ